MKNSKRLKSGVNSRLSLALALALAITPVSPAWAGSGVQPAYAAAVNANCDQYSNLVKSVYQNDVTKAQTNQAALSNLARLGAACLTTIENAINGIIPALSLSAGAALLHTLINEVESAVLGAACQIVTNQVNAAGQMVTQPIEQGIGMVNGTFSGAINSTLSSSTGGVVPSVSTPNIINSNGTLNVTNGSITSPITISPGASAQGAAASSLSSSSGTVATPNFWNSMTCSIFHTC